MTLGSRASSKAVDACVAEGSSPPPDPFDLRRRTHAAVDGAPLSRVGVRRRGRHEDRVAVVGYFFSYFARRSRGPSILTVTTRCAVLEVRGGRA
eukprot:scaffold27505_cov42-Phaeocystis_antarctica.AAC.1